MLNETAQGVLEATKGSIYTEVVLAVWVSIMLIFIIVAKINSAGHKTNWDNFWRVWTWTFIASGILVTIFVTSPETILDIINWIKEFFA